MVGVFLVVALAVGGWWGWRNRSSARPFDVVTVKDRVDIPPGDTLSPPPSATHPAIDAGEAYAIAHGAPFTRGHRPALRLGVLGNSGEGINPGAMQGKLVWVIWYRPANNECPVPQGGDGPPPGSRCNIIQLVDATTGRTDGGMTVSWTPAG
jgi:hypothetical protein